MRYDHYEAAGPLLVRMAGVPRTRRLPAFDGTDPLPYLRALAADPLLREAVRVASPDLALLLDRLEAGAAVPPKRLRKAALSLTRYALRHADRTTPFGLLAGVTVARVCPDAGAEVRGPGRKAARPDGAWLDDRLRVWTAVPEVRHGLDVVLNDLCRVHGGRLLVPAGGQDISVRRTALVDWVRDAAAAPVRYGDLLDRAVAAFPGAPAERLDDVLAVLTGKGFLLTSLDRPGPAEETLDRIEAAVAADPRAAEELRAVRAALAAYERTPPGAGGTALRTVFRAAGVPDDVAPAVPPVRVDLRLDADVRVPRAVLDEAERYVSVLREITPDRPPAGALAAYRSAFLERYGTASVPLGELVDPQRGLGFPASYRTAPGAPEAPGAVDHAFRARRRLLAELAQEALAGEGDELRLTPDVLAHLAPDRPDDPEPRAEPGSSELCFQLLSDSPAALARGDFRLVGGAHPGSWTAGATAGRFTELTGTTGAFARLMGALDDGDALPAQVVFRPHAPGALTALQVPRFLPHHIPVGAFADPAEDGHLDWRRLLVAADGSGLWLTDPGTGRRVLPVVPHMLTLHQAPHAARLLADLAHGGTPAWPGWDWHGLDDLLVVLPRVTSGRVVVSPKRWLPDRSLRRAAARPEGWDAAVAAWRDRYRVPERVQLARADRGFGLDLTDAWHRTLLRHEILAGDAARVVEDPTAGGRELGWAGGYGAEVLIPFVRRSRGREAAPGREAIPGVRETAPAVRAAAPAPELPTTPRPTTPRPADVRTRHLPGEDWLHAKLYAAESFHDELLAAHLPPLLRAVDAHVDHWFFIRYRDPEPHLRLRFHGEAKALATHVLPELARHVRDLQDAGLVREMTLDAYMPETDRYGGPGVLPHAERLFHLDSRSVLLQLAARRGGPPPPDAVLAAANHAVLLDAAYGPDWASWAAGAFPKGPAHAVYQRHRESAAGLVVPGRTAAALADRLSLPALADLWSDPPEARAFRALPLPHRDRILRSLLHMQYVRLLGLDPAGEERARAVLRGVARDRLGRLRHARRPAGVRQEA
ncbi:lantibiotic dehydratase [Streptomyces huiliensis]|uniref:lantibiotic dehydratase n=1 Tax=Streptomyces huiliensis TaxID=2876027 RepID=UPI001CBFB779|nr:lantibiotic dehydratase [Streptomyces huiliensis]MBZ4323279.1 lantibiotic dehydratase [Streptomyces huiliensis]